MKRSYIQALSFVTVVLIGCTTATVPSPVPNASAPVAASPSATPAARASVVTTGNVAHDKLLSLPPSTHARLLADIADDRCTGVDAFFRGMDKDKSAQWSVRCAAGNAFMVVIAADATGSTQVADCAVLKTLNVNCFEKLTQ